MKKYIVLAGLIIPLSGFSFGSLSATQVKGVTVRTAKARVIWQKVSRLTKKNLYVELNGGYDISDSDVSTSDYLNHGNNYVAGVNFGYNFTPHLALELGVTHFIPVKSKRASGASSLSQTALHLAFKGRVFLRHNFDLFAKLGVAGRGVSLPGVDNLYGVAFSLYGGAGMTYDFSSQCYASLSGIIYGNEKSKLTLLNPSGASDTIDFLSEERVVLLAIGYKF